MTKLLFHELQQKNESEQSGFWSAEYHDLALIAHKMLNIFTCIAQFPF